MGFIKTGDATPIDIFDHDGEELSDADIKKLADKPQVVIADDEDEETNPRELND